MATAPLLVLGVEEDARISARCRMPSCGLRPVKRSNFQVIAALLIEPEPEMNPRFSRDESISTRSHGNPQARAAPHLGSPRDR